MADVSLLDVVSKMIGIVAICAAAIGAAVQYIIHSRAESRQRAPQPLPPNVFMRIISNGSKNVGELFSGSIISIPAAESIVNVAIKYPILLEPAVFGLDVTAGFSPFAREAFHRLVRNYVLSRSLTEWGQDWKGYAQQHPQLS